MGILRADRITGLGGANAIKGSVKFSSGASGGGGGGASLDIDLDGATIGTSNFTIEAWVFWFGSYFHQITGAENTNFNFYINNDDGDLVFYDGSTSYDLSSSNVKPNEWTHIALVREGTSSNQTKVYINGANTQNITLGTNFSISRLATGAANFVTSNIYGNGYTSNLRFTLDAVYTSAFTPPNHELTVLDNTIVLCCQSPGNILQEATGKKIVVFKNGVNQGDPVASHFTPNSPVGFSTTSDVGSQYGTTFDGFGSFATSTYMLPPGGNTRERNRGRGLIFGGYSPSPAAHVNSIQFINIQSFGNAQDFGDLSSLRSQMGAVSSSTRAVSCGGGNDTPSDYTDTNTCEFVTIASTSNTTDFGDLTVSRQPYKGCSNDTRGIIFGGYIHPANSNTIDFITIATTGNATDFGDEIDTNRAGASCSSTTRGIVAGGYPATNRISFVEIATTGNAQDFGDLLNSVVAPSGCSNKTRGVFAGGATPTAINVIQFITMSSAGDATDFGDLNTTEKIGYRGTSNSIRGLFCGGYDGATFVNSISAINIATTGNAVDFGDISGTLRFASAVSDSHGGLE